MAYTTAPATIPSYYDKRFVERVTGAVALYNLLEKRPVPFNQGEIVYFARITNASTTPSAYKSTKGTVVTPEAIQDAQVSATLETYRNSKGLWGLAKITALSTYVDAAVDEQADQAAHIIEKRILQTAYGTSAAQSYGSGFSMQFADFTEVTNILEASAGAALIGTSRTITAAMIRKWVGRLRTRGVRPFDDSGMYLLAVHPDTEMAIQADSTWQATYAYTDPENMKKGVFGRYGGAKMVRVNDVATSANGSSGHTNYYSLLLGKGALAVSELDGGIKTFMTEGGTIADPAHETSSFSWKIHFVPAILNPSCGLICVTSDA